MDCCVRYTEKLDDKIRKNHLIPYRVIRETRYEKKCYYYSNYWDSIFKVLSVDYSKSGELLGAYIHYENGYYGSLCTELDINDYKLIKDTNNLDKINIINSGEPYSGAEIVYWFFINKITALNPVYRGFWKFIDVSSPHRISDNVKYYILADISPKTGNYIKCRIKKA
jgi:hypothetical protein